MSDYDNTNRGATWKNDKKETDRHPDQKGSINVDGKEYWLSIWFDRDKKNPRGPDMKLSVTAKEQQRTSGAGINQYSASQQAQTPPDDGFKDDSDIPFMNPYKHNEYLV